MNYIENIKDFYRPCVNFYCATLNRANALIAKDTAIFAEALPQMATTNYQKNVFFDTEY